MGEHDHDARATSHANGSRIWRRRAGSRCSPCNVSRAARSSERETTRLVTFNPSRGFSSVPEFDGFLEVDIGAEHFPWAFGSSHPHISGYTFLRGVLERSLVEAIYESFGTPYDDRMGSVWLNLRDCRGSRARGLVIEAFDGTTGELCASCGIVYTDEAGIPTVGLTNTDRSDLVAINFVPPGATTIVARDEQSGQVVGFMTMNIRAGVFNNIILRPSSRLQWGARPDWVR